MTSLYTQAAGHAIAFYEELERRASPDDGGNPVFMGNITNVYNSLGISSSMYSRVKRILTGSGAITMLQRGTANQPSIIALHGAPDAEALADQDLTQPRRLATMVGELEKRVAALESRLPLDVAHALREHEIRLNKLEGSVSVERAQTEDTETDQ